MNISVGKLNFDIQRFDFGIKQSSMLKEFDFHALSSEPS